MEQEDIKKVMSHLGKLSHKKKPRTKKYFKDLIKKRWDKYNKNKKTNENITIQKK